jgi:hypothetical protein
MSLREPDRQAATEALRVPQTRRCGFHRWRCWAGVRPRFASVVTSCATTGTSISQPYTTAPVSAHEAILADDLGAADMNAALTARQRPAQLPRFGR